MVNDDFSERVQAVKEITSLFRLERYVYIGIIIICLFILLLSTAIALINREIGPPELTSMFGSGGAITFMTGRLLHMWNRAIKLLDKSDEK